MKFCWEVYNKSDCETCPYFSSFKDGTTTPEKLPEFVKVEEEVN